MLRKKGLSAKGRGFTLVELLVVIAIIGILSTVAYVAIQKAQVRSQNNRMLDDLIAISNSLEQYRRDHLNSYPLPTPGDPASESQNILCFYADATYSHDCDAPGTRFRQGMIDNNLLTKRYLQKVPTDPRTGSRYVYGVSNDGKYFQVAGLYQEDDGSFTARTAENIAKGFELQSLIRAYNGPNFVVNNGSYLPYNPDYLVLKGTLDSLNGQVIITPEPPGGVVNGADVWEGNIIDTTQGGSVDIYFSDGSVTHIESGTKLTLKDLAVNRNDADGTFTKIIIKLDIGKIWNKVARLASTSEFRVETINGVLGVRGTEFGLSEGSEATDKWLVVASGSIDAQKLDAAGQPAGPVVIVNAQTAGEPLMLDLSQTALGAPASVPSGSVQEEFIQKSQASALHSGLIPYILGFVIPTNGTPDYYVTDVGINALNSANYSLTGFEVYEQETLLADVSAEVTDFTAKNQFVYDSAAKLYRLSLPLPPVANNRRVQQNLTLKAYADDAEGNRTYSAMSAPPTGFTVNINSGVKSPDFRESYPALQSLPGANPPAPPFADVPPVQEDLPPSAVIEVKNAQGDLLGTTAFPPPSGSISVIVGDAITLDASASTDPNTGDTLSYSWYKINPLPTPPTSLNNANDNITADTSAAGSTTYQVRVKDSTNLSSTADIIVTAELGNIAPTADFEFESTGIGTLTTDPSTGNATLTLTATDDATQVTVKANANGANYKSSDTDGTIASYAWISGVSSQQSDATTSINGTPGAAVQDIGFFVPDATTTDQTYMYNYALTVIDDGGKSSTKTKFLTVVREANISLQSVAVTGPATITSGATAATASYTATGTYSDSSTSDITSQCAWSVTGTSGPTISVGILTVPADYAGSNTVQCDLGGTLGSAAVEVTAPAPTITNLAIDCSGTGGFCSTGNTYPVTFNFTDATSYTTQLQLISGSTTLGSIDVPSGTLTGNSLTFNYALGNNAPATVRLTVTATGSGGEQSQSIDIDYF